jgi:hypothetical protein
VSTVEPDGRTADLPAEVLQAGQPLLDLLAGFIVELRQAGLPVSLTENLDAMEAVRTSPSTTARRSSTPSPRPW